MTHRVIYKAPGEFAELRDHDQELDFQILTGYVGGYLDPVPLPALMGLGGVGMYCNVEGAKLAMAPNFMVRGTMVCGPVVLFAISPAGVGTRETGLDAGQILVIAETFGWDHLERPSLRLVGS